MTRSQALLGARLIAVGRVLFGIGLLARPAALTRRWLGAPADTTGTQVAVRALGVRDAMLGALTLHTLGHPQIGARWVATCAVNDAVDMAATIAGRRDLPKSGVAATAVLAGGTVAASVAIAATLKATAPADEA